MHILFATVTNLSDAMIFVLMFSRSQAFSGQKMIRNYFHHISKSTFGNFSIVVVRDISDDDDPTIQIHQINSSIKLIPANLKSGKEISDVIGKKKSQM